MPKIEKNCQSCGNQFFVFPSNSGRKYCSDNCRKKEKVEVTCEICGKKDLVFPGRAKKYKTCSTRCRGIRSGKHLSKKIDHKCPICNAVFSIKKSQLGRRNYCSKKCMSIGLQCRYVGNGNPNHKGILMTPDGYIKSTRSRKTGRSLHRDIVAEFFGLIDLPRKYIVHHRDCNKLNNDIRNLVCLSYSDHMWLHTQFGNAILWAFCRGKIGMEMAEWSDVPERAKRLLPTDVTTQTIDPM